MDEKFKVAIDKIVLLTKQNPEFNDELRKRLDLSISANSFHGNIPENIIAIRSALEIRGNYSINYDFVEESRLKDQLLIDNLRMENASLNLKEREETRFYVFCVNAFYQIENIINYYYFKTFPNINDLLSEIEIKTKDDKSQDGDYSFQRKKDNDKNKEKEVTDIPINFKLNAFCNTFFINDKIKLSLSTLRKVRNEGEHRCDAIFQKKDEKEKLYQFYKYNSFESIRKLLERLTNEVKKQLSMKVECCLIKTMLPGACFISIKGQDVQLPNKLFKFVKENKVGDNIEVAIENGTITRILK